MAKYRIRTGFNIARLVKFFLILSCLDYFVTVVVVVVVVMYFGDCTLESCCHFRL